MKNITMLNKQYMKIKNKKTKKVSKVFIPKEGFGFYNLIKDKFGGQDKFDNEFTILRMISESNVKNEELLQNLFDNEGTFVFEPHRYQYYNLEDDNVLKIYKSIHKSYMKLEKIILNKENHIFNYLDDLQEVIYMFKNEIQFQNKKLNKKFSKLIKKHEFNISKLNEYLLNYNRNKCLKERNLNKISHDLRKEKYIKTKEVLNK